MLLTFRTGGTAVIPLPQVAPSASLIFCFRLLEDRSRELPQEEERKKHCHAETMLFFWFGFKSRQGCHGYRVMQSLVAEKLLA